MYYIGNLVKSVTGVYNQINSATLTGAIDIVVVKQADGTFIGSPFHVRFGKLGVLSSTEKVVEISINDEEVDIQMKLGQAGEAFFVEKIASSPDGDIVPYNLATSPIPSSTFLTDEQFNFKKVERRDDMETETNFPENPVILPEIVEHKAKTKDDNTSLSRTFSEPISIKKAQNSIHLSPKQNRHAIQRISEMQSEYPLSDMDSPLSGSPPDDDSTRRIYSDTEVEGHLTLAKNTSLPEDKGQDPDMTWEWGMLPEGKIAVQKPPTKTPRGAHAHEKSGKKHHRKHRTKGGARPKMKVPSEGLLLDEVLGMEDKEVADLYFNRGNSLDDLVLDEDTIDARGESTPAVDAVKEKNPFSFNNTSPIKAQQQEDPEVTKEEDKIQEAVEKKSDEEVVINVEEMAIPSETSVGSKEEGDEKGDETLPLGDEVEEPKDIVLSLCGGLMSRRVVPEKFNDFVVSYEGFCQNPSVILSNPKLVIKINESYYNWAVAGPYLVSYMAYDKTLQPDSLKMLKQRHMPRKRRGWFQWRTPQEQESSEDEIHIKILKEDQSMDKLSEADVEADLDSNQGGGSDTQVLLSDDENQAEYKKTLRLTSSQWESLKLKPGKNTVTFTVTTRYQGKAEAKARIFLWSHENKVVISDIDGTITKSDVLGQILPAMGRDWSQTGVTGLFSKIRNNGYNFIYLSARAISQADLTRNFLGNIKQGELTLPEGPVLLTPTSLVTAFRKEVIERKPEEFKISCMKDIQSLYDKKSNPFFAGFGNRINDVYAYRAVGIPISRIFTINYRGEIKHEISTAFSTSYSELIGMVDQMFPPMTPGRSIDSTESEFTSFSYWRAPLIPLDSVDELESLP